MKALKLIALGFLVINLLSLNVLGLDKAKAIRVASYNVEFGKSATPEQIGEMFKPYNLDIIGFDEAPDGDWTARVGKVLGMKYSFVGKISSANHKDKYKTILSRTPLEGKVEHDLSVDRRRCWNPASALRAVTKIDGVAIAFYSLHICSSRDREKTGHAYKLASEVLPKENEERVIVVGDFNNNIGDIAMNTIEKAGFKATWEELKIDVSKEYTYNAFDPKKNLGVIDHILYKTSAGAKTTDGGIIELKKPLSDHKAIWAEIVFPRELKKATNFQENIDPKTSKPGEVRVMSWNILYKGWEKKGHDSWKERSASAVQILAKYRPDVVGLQEESKEQINYIRKALSEYTYLDPYKNKGGGLLIRTKAWRVIKSGKIAIPGRRQASWSLLESTRNRQQWMFYNAHLIHRTAANSAAHRMEGAKSIVKHIVSHAPQGLPVVFTGDFNALDDMPVMRYLAGDSESPVKMLNAFNLVHGANDPRGTFRGLSKEHICDRIDHILINKDAAVQNAKIVYYDELPGIWPSDHYPIQAILKKKLPHTVEKEAITKTKKIL